MNAFLVLFNTSRCYYNISPDSKIRKENKKKRTYTEIESMELEILKKTRRFNHVRKTSSQVTNNVRFETGRVCDSFIKYCFQNATITDISVGQRVYPSIFLTQWFSIWFNFIKYIFFLCSRFLVTLIYYFIRLDCIYSNRLFIPTSCTHSFIRQQL